MRIEDNKVICDCGKTVRKLGHYDIHFNTNIDGDYVIVGLEGVCDRCGQKYFWIEKLKFSKILSCVEM